MGGGGGGGGGAHAGFKSRRVLPENVQLLKFKRIYIRDHWGVFSISSIVRVSMTSFRAIALHSCQNFAKAGWKMASNRNVKFTEAYIKSFTEEHVNTKSAKLKKETSCG